MGILDSKTRFVDTIVTDEGRKQLAQGKMRVVWATFTDCDAFYEADIVSGSSDASARLYFEATNLPQDQITFDSDEVGNVSLIKTTNKLSIFAGKILSGTVSGSTRSYLKTVDDSVKFASLVSTAMSSSIENFSKLQALGTMNSLFDESSFIVSENQIKFSLTDKKPYKQTESQVANINHLERLIEDRRLSNVPNFLFLPPVNKRKADIRTTKKLGNYVPISWTKKLTHKEVLENIVWFENNGFTRTLRFDPTTNTNRMICQFFEVNGNKLVKLDTVDFGASNEKERLFFIGKLLTDEFGVDTFVHLFTLVFE